MLRLVLICFAASVLTVRGYAGTILSSSAEVAVITCGPGADLYSTFGHSAISITDPATGLARVYNYGTFDFDTPNFYLLFAQGKLAYQLSVSDYHRFIAAYAAEGRWVIKQVLLLHSDEKQALYDFLEWNARPENKSYRYDFLYDNCSTRIRDALEQVLGEKLVYPAATADSAASFRDYLDLYLVNHPWSDLGIDLALGLPCDAQPTWRQQMFLPDLLKHHLLQARLNRDGALLPLVGEEVPVLPQTMQLPQGQNIVWIFIALSLVSVLFTIFAKASWLRWFDVLLFFCIGLLGVLIALLWFATDHLATKNNLNLLWALPTWLWASFSLISGHVRSSYFKWHAVYLFALMVFWALIPQDFHVAVMPLIIALLARSWAWQKYKFKREQR